MTQDKKPLFGAILFLVSFASAGTVCIAPALPEMTGIFQSTEGALQQLIAWYLIGYALGQLLYGPIGHYVGRKQTAVWSITLSVILAALCFLTLRIPSVSLLVVLRFFLGLTMGVGLKMAFYYIATYYSDAEMSKRTSYLMASFALAPSLSVFVTGWLVDFVGWTGTLYFQLAYCIIGLLFAITLPKDRTAADHKSSGIWHSYWLCLKNPIILLSALSMGVATTFVYVFASEAPFIAMTTLGISSGQYGLLNFFAVIGILIGGISGGKCAHYFKRSTFIIGGLSIMTLASILMLLAFAMGYIALFSLFFPIFVAFIGVALFQANSASNAMSEPQNKSYISSTINFINMAFAVIAVQVLSLTSPSNPLIMPIIFLAVTLIGYLIILILSKYRKTRYN